MQITLILSCVFSLLVLVAYCWVRYRRRMVCITILIDGEPLKLPVDTFDAFVLALSPLPGGAYATICRNKAAITLALIEAEKMHGIVPDTINNMETFIRLGWIIDILIKGTETELRSVLGRDGLIRKDDHAILIKWALEFNQPILAEVIKEEFEARWGSPDIEIP